MGMNFDFFIFWANGLRVIFRNLKTHPFIYSLLGGS